MTWQFHIDYVGPKYHSVISCNRKCDIMSIKSHGSILQKRWFQFSNLINNSLQGYDLIGIHFEDGSRCDCTSLNEVRLHSLHAIEEKIFTKTTWYMHDKSIFFYPITKLYTPSTLNIDFIQCHTQLNVCAVKWITHDLIQDFHFTFQAYTLPHTLNGICVAYLDFILEF